MVNAAVQEGAGEQGSGARKNVGNAAFAIVLRPAQSKRLLGRLVAGKGIAGVAPKGVVLAGRRNNLLGKQAAAKVAFLKHKFVEGRIGFVLEHGSGHLGLVCALLVFLAGCFLLKVAYKMRQL